MWINPDINTRDRELERVLATLRGSLAWLTQRNNRDLRLEIKSWNTTQNNDKLMVKHLPFKSAGLCAGWAAAVDDNHPWIQVDFDDVVYITALITQGRNDMSQWVTAYNVMHGGDVQPTKYITDACGIPTEASFAQLF